MLFSYIFESIFNFQILEAEVKIRFKQFLFTSKIINNIFSAFCDARITNFNLFL
ncbi:hypothetical protein pb186bvf_011023 [Paramecium bursaria]